MADNELVIRITGDVSKLKEATDAAKQQIDSAGKSVDMLADFIGVKVPDGIKQMLTSCEFIGPALEAAFAPLAVIALGLAIFEATEKAKKHREELEKAKLERWMWPPPSPSTLRPSASQPAAPGQIAILRKSRPRMALSSPWRKAKRWSMI